MKYCPAVCHLLVWHQPYLSNYIGNRGNKEKAKVELTKCPPHANPFLRIATCSYPTSVPSLPHRRKRRCPAQAIFSKVPENKRQSHSVTSASSLQTQGTIIFTQVSLTRTAVTWLPADTYPTPHHDFRWENYAPGPLTSQFGF